MHVFGREREMDWYATTVSDADGERTEKMNIFGRWRIYIYVCVRTDKCHAMTCKTTDMDDAQ